MAEDRRHKSKLKTIIRWLWIFFGLAWYVAHIRLLKAPHSKYVERYLQSKNYVRNIKRKTLLKYWAVGQSKCWLRVFLGSSSTLLEQDFEWKLIFWRWKKDWKNERTKIKYFSSTCVMFSVQSIPGLFRVFFSWIFLSFLAIKLEEIHIHGSWFMVVFSVLILFLKDLHIDKGMNIKKKKNQTEKWIEKWREWRHSRTAHSVDGEWI